MPFRFIQIPANGQGSAKEELNRLLGGGRIVSVSKKFVPNGEDSFWVFCIEFFDVVLSVDKGRGGPKIDYKEVFDEAQFAVFARLRDLRKALQLLFASMAEHDLDLAFKRLEEIDSSCKQKALAGMFQAALIDDDKRQQILEKVDALPDETERKQPTAKILRLMCSIRQNIPRNLMSPCHTST